MTWFSLDSPLASVKNPAESIPSSFNWKMKLLTAIRAVSAGGKYLSHAVGHLADSVAAHPGLTAHELEVLTWIARGHSNSQIAGELHVVEDTVKSHVKNILMKLGVSSRSKAVATGVQRGLVQLDGS